MVRPSKVIGFLDFVGPWDPSLMLVMGSALVISIVAWRIVAKAHNATIAPVNVASAALPPPEKATIPATRMTPPRTEESTT